MTSTSWMEIAWWQNGQEQQDALSGSPSARNFDYAKLQGAIIPYPLRQVSPDVLLPSPQSLEVKSMEEYHYKLRMFPVRAAKREFSLWKRTPCFGLSFRRNSCWQHVLRILDSRKCNWGAGGKVCLQCHTTWHYSYATFDVPPGGVVWGAQCLT